MALFRRINVSAACPRVASAAGRSPTPTANGGGLLPRRPHRHSHQSGIPQVPPTIPIISPIPDLSRSKIGECQATAILSPPNATATLSPLVRILVPPVWKEVPCGSSIRPAADGIWYGRRPRCKSVSTGPFASTIPTTAPSAPPASRTERLQENPMTLPSRPAVCYRPRCRRVALLRRRPNARTGCAQWAHSRLIPTPVSYTHLTLPTKA